MITRILITTLAMLLSTSSFALAGDSATEKGRALEQIAKGKIGRFTLVYNVNNSGYIDVCGCKRKKVRNGSLPRRSSFLRQLRATGRELLLLDGGSTLFTVSDKTYEIPREEAIGKARVIVEAYNRMGYRAMTIGVSDFAMSLDTLEDVISKAKFDVLSANVVDRETKKPVFKTHAVYEIGGVRVGVIGLTLETIGRAYLAKNAPTIELANPIEAAKKIVPELEKKSDVIIALSHLRPDTNYKLIGELSSIGILVDPYIQDQSARTWIDEDEWLGALEETLFLRSDGQGARLGVVDVSVDLKGAKLRHALLKQYLESLIESGQASDEQKAELAVYGKRNLYNFKRVSIGPHHLNDPGIDKLILDWKSGIDPSKSKIDESALPMRTVYATTEGCKGCHEAQYDFWAGTKHARAVASLVKTGDQKRFDCIGCHSLGYGTAFLDTTTIGKWGEVQCESCHGANPAHLEKPEENRFARIGEKTCLTCHNKEHTLKEFQFAAMRRKVACPKGSCASADGDASTAR